MTLRQSIDLGTLGNCSVVSVDGPAIILACALGAGRREGIQSRCIFVLSARIGRKASSLTSRSGAPWRWYWVEGAHPLQEERTSESSYSAQQSSETAVLLVTPHVMCSMLVPIRNSVL